MTDEHLAAKERFDCRRARATMRRMYGSWRARRVFIARRSPALARVTDDALQVGRLAFWRCVKSWVPSVAPLEVLAWKPIERAVWEEAARMGGGALVHYGRKAPRVECLDAPIGTDPDSPSFVDSMPAQNPDMADIADANRLLGQLSGREVEVLCRVATGELLHEIGADYGVTRERVRQWHKNAKIKAERIAGRMIRKKVAA